jgi:hypothetical protein
MASVTSLCNISLSHIGSARIDGFYGNSEEEIQCALLYELARDALLEAHDWTFAKSRFFMSLTAEDPTNYDYSYIYPADCIIPRRIINPNEVSAYSFGGEIGSPSIVGTPFMEMTSPDGMQKRILTDKEDAELEYTLRITDINMMSSNFQLALTYFLGSMLVIPLKGDLKKQAELFNLHFLFVGKAQAMNANVDNVPVSNTSSIAQSRRR